MICPVCDGKGRVPCAKCSGRGQQWNSQLKRTEPCTWCNQPNAMTQGRTGYIGIPGVLQCSGCKGTGYIPEGGVRR
jgi:hypothetical protein